MRLIAREYIKYKTINSTFTGLTLGALFTIYSPLEPSIFSVGGVILAIAMLFIARLYSKILFIEKFFQISLFVELVMFALIFIFLLKPYSYESALLIYAGYQLTFAFGSYLVRAETLFAKHKKLLTWIDVGKQSGYLAGMLISWIFYKVFAYYGIDEKNEALYYLHFPLIIIEIFVVIFLLRSFKR